MKDMGRLIMWHESENNYDIAKWKQSTTTGCIFDGIYCIMLGLGAFFYLVF